MRKAKRNKRKNQQRDDLRRYSENQRRKSQATGYLYEIILSESDQQESKAFSDWLDKWETELESYPWSENQGCGCCVSIYQFDAPDEALEELREITSVNDV